MIAEGFFLTSMMLMILFNIGYIFANPSVVNTMLIGTLTSAIPLIVGILSALSISFLGSGVKLNDSITGFIIGCAVLINALFQVNLLGVPIGMGLANNLLVAFGNTGDAMGLPFMFAMGLSVATFISGIMVFTK